MVKIKSYISDFITLSVKFGFHAGSKLLFFQYSKQKKTKSVMINFNSDRLKLFFRLATTDFSVFRQIFIKKDYEVRINFTPKYILDAGANNGFSSVFFSLKFPGATVIAIEPDTENYSILLKNINEYKKIIPLNFALWNERCNVNVIQSDTYNKDAVKIEKDENEKNEVVEAESINSILSSYNISAFDIIKIDIEGSEKEIFLKNFEWITNTRIIIIELHDWITPHCSYNLFKTLIEASWGFYILIKGENLILFREYLDYLNTVKLNQTKKK